MRTSASLLQTIFALPRLMPVLTLMVSAHLNPFLYTILTWNTAAKRGSTPLLAVATEQGTVHIINTSKRKDWDAGKQTTV